MACDRRRGNSVKLTSTAECEVGRRRTFAERHLPREPASPEKYHSGHLPPAPNRNLSEPKTQSPNLNNHKTLTLTVIVSFFVTLNPNLNPNSTC